MFIGHYAPAFVAAALARRDRPMLGLGAMFVAAQFVDIAFFGFVLTGIEHMRETPGWTVMNAGDFYDMPYTHSLLGTLGFAGLWALIVRLRRGTWRAASIGAAVVASHWLLDLLVHAPDLTLFAGGRRFGLALWNDPQVAMPLELGVLALAIVFYASRTRAAGRIGHVTLVLLVAALLAVQGVDWLAPQPVVPVDPVPAATPLTALAAYILLALLAAWAGATRHDGAGPSVVAL